MVFYHRNPENIIKRAGRRNIPVHIDKLPRTKKQATINNAEFRIRRIVHGAALNIAARIRRKLKFEKFRKKFSAGRQATTQKRWEALLRVFVLQRGFPRLLKTPGFAKRHFFPAYITRLLAAAAVGRKWEFHYSSARLARWGDYNAWWVITLQAFSLAPDEAPEAKRTALLGRALFSYLKRAAHKKLQVIKSFSGSPTPHRAPNDPATLRRALAPVRRSVTWRKYLVQRAAAAMRKLLRRNIRRKSWIYKKVKWMRGQYGGAIVPMRADIFKINNKRGRIRRKNWGWSIPNYKKQSQLYWQWHRRFKGYISAMIRSRRPFAVYRPVALSANLRKFKPIVFNIGDAALSRLTRKIARFARMRQAVLKRARLEEHRAEGYVILPRGTAVKIDEIDSDAAPWAAQMQREVIFAQECPSAGKGPASGLERLTESALAARDNSVIDYKYIEDFVAKKKEINGAIVYDRFGLLKDFIPNKYFFFHHRYDPLTGSFLFNKYVNSFLKHGNKKKLRNWFYDMLGSECWGEREEERDWLNTEAFYTMTSKLRPADINVAVRRGKLMLRVPIAASSVKSTMKAVRFFKLAAMTRKYEKAFSDKILHELKEYFLFDGYFNKFYTDYADISNNNRHMRHYRSKKMY